MKPKYILTALFLLTIVVVMDSCRKEEDPLRNGGCGDINSPVNGLGYIDYDDGSCLYGFITEYQITYHPEFDNAAGTGTDWDIGLIDTDADLILRIKQDTSSVWFFDSESIGLGTPQFAHTDTAVFPAPVEYQLWNDSYSWNLYDYDLIGGNDLICSGQFNAIENATDGYVTTVGYNSAGDSTELRIKYALRKSY
jgi:hypothetical protein